MRRTSSPLPVPEDVPDMPLQADSQLPRLPDDFGDAVILLALFEKLLGGLARRCPHGACRRRRTCCFRQDVCALAPLAPKTRDWLAGRMALPLLEDAARREPEAPRRR